MKRASALILMVIYLAFTLSAMGYSHSNAVYMHAVSAASCDDAGDDSSCEAHFDATGQFKKTPKHPTHPGKIKIPRLAFANVPVTGWLQAFAHDASSFTSFSRTNNLPFSALYLKHRALLI
jgi:hypothetical protein